MSDLNNTAKEAVESQLIYANRILSSYDFQVAADYAALTDNDASQLLTHIRAATQLCIDSEAGRVMEALDAGYHKLPVASIQEVQEHPNIFVPRLMRSLQRATERVRKGDDAGGQSSFFALFLLAELNTVEAFPALLAALRLPDERAFAMLGGAVHEVAPRVLACFSYGSGDEIAKLIARQPFYGCLAAVVLRTSPIRSPSSRIGRHSVKESARHQQPSPSEPM